MEEEAGSGYGEFVKLRERLQSAGFTDEDAQKAVYVVMEWCAEMASRANRSYRPMAETFVGHLAKEELPVHPPAGDLVPESFHQAARSLIRPPKSYKQDRVPS